MDLSETKNLATHEPNTLDEASKLLLKAADRLENGGWKQHCYGDLHGTGPVCMEGALLSEDMASFTHHFAEAARRIQKAIGSVHVPAWNDHPLRTQAEVVAKLRAAALSGA